MISSGSVWGSIQLPRCSELGSGIAGIELVCGAECSPDQAAQLHKPMLFLAGGEVSATSATASSSGKRGTAKKERKRGLLLILKSLLFAGVFQKYSLSAMPVGCHQWRTSTDSFTAGLSSPSWILQMQLSLTGNFCGLGNTEAGNQTWIANSTYLIGGLAWILTHLNLGITLLGAQVSFTSLNRTIKIIKYILIHGSGCWRER